MTDYQPWTFDVQIAPGFSPKNPPTDGDFVSLGAPLSLSTDTGRQDDLDEFQPGAYTIELDNTDETLDQLLAGSPLENAGPSTPLRVLATLAAEVRTVLTGYTLDGFAPQGQSIVVQVVDWMGWANTVDSADCPWSAWVTMVQPVAWYRGFSPTVHLGYTDTFPNLVPLWNSAAILGGPGGDLYGNAAKPDFVERQDTALVTDGVPPHLFLGNAASNSGLIMNIGDALGKSAQWLACGWFRTSAFPPNSVLWGGSDWSVSMNASGHLDAAVTVSGVVTTATVAIDHDDNAVHLWFLKVRSQGGGRSMKLYTDLGSATTAIVQNNTSGGGQLNMNGSGCEVGDFTYFAGSGLDAVFSVTDEGGMPPANWVAFQFLWTADTVSDRVDHVIQAAAVPPPDLALNLDSTIDMAYYTPAGTLAADMTTLGSSFLGGTYCLRDGTVRIRDAGYTSSDDWDFDNKAAVFTDDPTAVAWTDTSTDAFTRANNTDIGTTWGYDGEFFAGQIGINSNKAYVSSAPTTYPVIRWRAAAFDVAVSVDISSGATGQGVGVHYEPGASLTGGRFIAVVIGAGTVNVKGWVDGVSTSIGNTGATAMGSTLHVTTAGDQLSVQIDAGTVYTFTITDPDLLVGHGVGLVYDNLGVLPAGSAKWDNFSATWGADPIRLSSRSRTGTRADRIINLAIVEFTDNSANVYARDEASQLTYGYKSRTFTTGADTSPATRAVLLGFADDVIAAKKDPPVEIGDITLRPWGDQALTDWVMRDLELERKVTYREALYWSGTEIINDSFRIAGIKWDWSAGTDWTVTLKLVPA